MIYIKSQQSVFPKTIYIGDKAELRCSFNCGIELKAGELSAQGFSDSLDFSLYDVQKILLQKSGTDYYTLVINFIPWHTGALSIPDFQIEGAGTIHFEDVAVLSLVQSEGVTDLRSYSSPLLLPGTTYKIYGGLAAGVVLLILIIRLIVKWHSVVSWFKNVKLRRQYAHSRRLTVKALKALVNQKGNNAGASASELSTRLQKIMREYLEVRLAYPFTKTLTSEMSLAFEKATFQLADENRLNAFEDIIAAFVRTDYIRFSGADSADARFEDGELQKIINNLISDIQIIEEGGKNV